MQGKRIRESKLFACPSVCPLWGGQLSGSMIDQAAAAASAGDYSLFIQMSARQLARASFRVEPTLNSGFACGQLSMGWPRSPAPVCVCARARQIR